MRSVFALEQVKKADKPMLGIFFFVLYCFLNTVASVFTQLLYKREVLNPFQMLFIRSAIGLVIMAAIMNKNIKKHTWDSVTKDKVGSLIFKTFTGTTTTIIVNIATKYIPLTIIAVVSNLAPIVVVILAFLILKEQVRRFDVLMMLLSLVGIFTIIFTG